MSRMSKELHDKLYPILIKNNGAYCALCHKLESETKEKLLVIDHRNNDNSDNRLENLQLLCRSCNFIKNPEDEITELSESETDLALKKNEVMEKEFRRWIYGHVLEMGKVLLKDAIYGGAEIVGGSPATTTRYIKKMTSIAGMYEIVQLQDSLKYLRFKKEYR